jgi:hypothetical protein
MRGTNRNGDYRNGNPVTLPKDSDNKVDWTPKPSEFGNPSNQPRGNTILLSHNYGNLVGVAPVTPTFDPPAGTYGVPQMVKIISAGNDAIYFTTDGTTPTTASRLYEGNVFVPKSETLKAIAVVNGVSSTEGDSAYVITNS